MTNIIDVKTSIDSWLKDFETVSAYEDSETEYGFDLLAAAIVLKNRAPNMTCIDDPLVVNDITPEIEAQAEQIRKHYTKAWFWLTMNGERLTPFRQRAHYLLQHRVRKVTKRDVGLYVKMPWFYEEDMNHAELKKLAITDDLPRLASGRGKSMRRLEFLKTSNGWQGKRRTTRYWFKDDNNFLYGIELEMNNPLLPMFDDEVKSRPNGCVFETYLSENRVDKMNYYKLHSYKLLKEPNEIS